MSTENTQLNRLPKILWILADDKELKSDLPDAIRHLVKQLKITTIKTEAGFEIEPPDIVKNMMLKHFFEPNPALEDEFSGDKQLKKAFTFIGKLVADHKEIVKTKKDEDEQEKKLKAAAKEQSQKEKEEEQKKMKEAADAFESGFTKVFEDFESKALEAASKMINNIKLPSNIAITANGMGLAIGEGVTAKDLSAAMSAIISTGAAAESISASVQFMAGDIANAMVKRKVYPTADAAAKGVQKMLVEKLGKNLAHGSVKQYAAMAAKVPAELRSPRVAPTYYLKASSLSVPSLANGGPEKPGDRAELEVKFDNKRQELYKELNEGKLTSVKEVEEAIVAYKESLGFKAKPKDETKKNIAEAMKQYFFADFILCNFIREHLEAGEKEGETVTIEGAKLEATAGVFNIYSRDELLALKQEAFDTLQALVYPNLEEYVAGFKLENPGTKEEVRKPMIPKDPFWKDDSKAEQKEEPKTEEAPTTAQADGTSTEEEDEDEDEGEVTEV